MPRSVFKPRKASRWKKTVPTVYADIVANQLRSRLSDEREFTVRRNVEKHGQRITCRFTSMSVCSVERNLKVHPKCKNSAAMIVISGTGSGEKRIQKKL